MALVQCLPSRTENNARGKDRVNKLKLARLAKLGGNPAVLAVVAACATTAATPQVENMLSAAGFKIITASTPQQQNHLRTLTAGKISVVQRNGKTCYVYPDMAHNQIYVGKPSQYRAYQRMRLGKQPSNEDLEAARSDAEANTFWDGWGSFETWPMH